MTKSTRNQDSTKARTRTATEPPCGPVTALAVSCHGDGSPGAPPSNTAPANYKDDPACIFRTGIDSLYLSWSGTLFQEYDDLLISLKEKAQTADAKEQSQAVLQLLDHRFEVSDKGKGRFPFVLRDNWFHIQLSRTHSTSMPMAMVQIRSEVLSKSGYLLVVRKLEALLSLLGEISHQKISRIDICADFYTRFNLELAQRPVWVMNARKFDTHYDGFRFSGFSFGKRGSISGRLYDKALEIESSQKTFFFPLWAEGGWLGELPVWRMEFEFHRSTLREMGVNSIHDLEEKLNGLWQYCCQKWLRLTLPSLNDSARTRWPNHPVWNSLEAARFGSGDLHPLTRTRKERLPSDERLFVHGMSTLTSVMAEEGITDINEALKRVAQKAQAHHKNRRESGYSLGNYLHTKAEQKARKYNTRLKPDPIDNDPKAYRKAKEGE